MDLKPLIFDLNLTDLQHILADWGQPAYRATQLWQGLYRGLATHPGEITNLPRRLGEQLESAYRFTALEVITVQRSSDGQTTKTLFRLPDGNAIEAVLMAYAERRTLCISTQAGCAMGCVFCATGQMGFKRNLSRGEIAEQVLFYARQLAARGEAVTNVVLMGMGEPFHNYEASLEAIDLLNQPDGFNLGARRFTISTVGLVPAIRRFAQERRQINLAISLHAADDELRHSMLPINARYPIADLLDACREYVDLTGRRVTFEWALIQDVNDTPAQAQRLAHLLQGLLCHVNIIPLNPTQGYAGAKSTPQRVAEFQRILNAAGVPCTVRVRRGIDIQAGCGQLASSDA